MDQNNSEYEHILGSHYLQRFLKLSYNFLSRSKGYILGNFRFLSHKMLKDILKQFGYCHYNLKFVDIVTRYFTLSEVNYQRCEPHIDFHTLSVIITLAGGAITNDTLKLRRFIEFLYCNLLLLYLSSSHRWRKVVY